MLRRSSFDSRRIHSPERFSPSPPPGPANLAIAMFSRSRFPKPVGTHHDHEFFDLKTIPPLPNALLCRCARPTRPTWPWNSFFRFNPLFLIIVMWKAAISCSFFKLQTSQTPGKFTKKHSNVGFRPFFPFHNSRYNINWIVFIIINFWERIIEKRINLLIEKKLIHEFFKPLGCRVGKNLAGRFSVDSTDPETERLQEFLY